MILFCFVWYYYYDYYLYSFNSFLHSNNILLGYGAVEEIFGAETEKKGYNILFGNRWAGNRVGYT